MKHDEATPLRVRGLDIAYDQPVVSGFDLQIQSGECVALMGPSGSGKSSIIACVVGMQTPQAGSIEIGGVPMGASAAGRARLRRELMGISYQNPGLLPELTVAENVAVTLLFEGQARESALGASVDSLARVGLEDHAEKLIHQISGGQAQRVSLARALVRSTAVLLVADEPTASLDPVTAAEIAQLLVTRVRERGMGALLATHDPRVADTCDRVIDLRNAA